ncbi:MAG: InlB B-repeat-containing protein, partial [Christensenellales bacterium]
MKTKFRVFTALLLALMVLVSVLPLQAAAEIGQSGTATRAEAENTAEAALSVKPMLTPSYTPSASYRSGKYYTQLCNVSLTGNQRTDLVNVARSQLGYHEGDNTSQLHGESSGSRNYTEYGYWYGTQVQGNSGGSYYAWCAYFISWCARQAGIPTSIISNASYACAGSDNGDFKNLDYYARGSYTPKVGDLVFFCWEGNSSCWDHVEIVIGVDSSNVTTLGGNTSTNNVKTRSWKLSNSYIRGYGVPKYTSKLDAPYVYSIATGPWKTYVEWYPVKGATSYELRIYAANDTANPVNTVKSITNTVYGIKLSPGEYYTSVTAVNPNYSPTYTTGPMSPKFTVPSTNDRDPLYPKASTFYNGHLYILYDVQTGCWDQANEMCNTWGGHLVTINSAQEQAVVYELAKKSSKSYCKIGAKANASRQWSWVTGENFSYANWKSGQPDNYNGMEFYAEMDIKAGGTWDDCANVRYGDVCFIVEHEMNETPIKTYSVDNKVKYAVFDKAMPWEDAKNYCEQLGGHLATISNKAEQDIIAGLIVNGSRDAYSIGATKRGLDNWSWIDGKEFSYTNWDDGYPVNPYGEGYYIHMVKSGKWHDIYNITHYGFVCEFELPYTLTINYLYENGSTAAPSYTARVNYGDTYSVTSPNVQGHSPSRQIVSGTMGATNMSVDVVYSINTYTVTFKDWNGTVLKTQQVQYGGAATAPANPTRTGYTFTGWDKAFTNVTANLVVTAQYSINTYTVTFKDWNGTVLKTQQVQYGGAATAPANPTRTGYTFTGWDKAFTNVTANLVVTAQYSINTYTVTFKDWNGTVLKTQQVQYGGAATAPANPTRTGYTFTGWDKAFNNVTANLVVTAQYVQNEPVSTPVPSDVPQIVVESKTTSAGSTVAVNISIANNPGIVSMTLHVNFDSRLELVSVQDTGLLPGQVHPTVMINPYTLVWANDSATQNYTVNGTIATLNFNVPENLEEGDYAISVSYDNDEYEIYDCNAETIDFAVVNGKISVTDIIYGDVNGDGKVNNLDRLVLTRYLANWPDYPASRIKPGADTNADGKINNLDRLILTRHLANWPDYATLPWSSGKSGSAAVEPTSYTKGNEPTVIVNSVEAMPGETVSVSIDIANNPGIISMTLDVAFDPSLTLLSVDNTGLFPGYIPCAVMQNPYTLVWANDAASEDIYVNGTIVNFVFKVADDAEPGSYSIVVTYNLDDYDIYNYNSEPVEFAIQNGAVTVAAAQPEMHTVTFKDWDGIVLKTQEVQHGGDAEAPADPTRVGYTFTGWDKAFTNITADLVVTAQYEINTYTVTFKDWDGTVLKTQEVQHGGDAEAPADPTRTGYTFTGWDKEFTNITADLVVTAQYEINTY